MAGTWRSCGRRVVRVVPRGGLGEASLGKTVDRRIGRCGGGGTD
jgi:hypothetical protein